MRRAVCGTHFLRLSSEATHCLSKTFLFRTHTHPTAATASEVTTFGRVKNMLIISIIIIIK